MESQRRAKRDPVKQGGKKPKSKKQQVMETLSCALSCCMEKFGGVEDIEDKEKSFTSTTNSCSDCSQAKNLLEFQIFKRKHKS